MTRMAIVAFTITLSAWVATALGETNLTVGQISIELNDIFSEEEIDQAHPVLGLLKNGMNALHITTRENVLRREFLFQTGEPFAAELLAETERNLRTLGFLNTIYVVATDTTVDGRVNVKVSVRESWTLKTNLSYTRASNGDQRWNVSLSETNFLGLGTTLGAGIGGDEIRSFWNLWYRHRRMFGSKLWFGVDYSDLDSGHIKKVFISQPFFAQADPWSFDFSAYDSRYEIRHYLSNGGPAGWDPTKSEHLSAMLPLRQRGFDGRFMVRIKGRTEGRIWRLGGGLRLADKHFSVNSGGNLLSDGRTVDLEFLLAEGEPLELAQGLRIWPYLRLQSIGRQWGKSTFVLQYGPVEDIPLGMFLDIKTGMRGTEVGSNNGCVAQLYSEMVISRWTPLAGGLALLSGQGRVATGQGNCDSHNVALLGGWVGKAGSDKTPWLTRIFAEIGHGKNLAGNEVFTLGLDRGLRTLDFDGMAGNRLVRWNLEQGKVSPWEPLGLFRLGGAAFYSGGIARFADEDRDLSNARHEVGLGIRLGPIRSANAHVGRMDVSWSLDGSRGPVFTATTRGTF